MINFGNADKTVFILYLLWLCFYATWSFCCFFLYQSGLDGSAKKNVHTLCPHIWQADVGQVTIKCRAIVNCNLLPYGIKLSSVVHLFLLRTWTELLSYDTDLLFLCRIISAGSVIYFVTQDFGLQEVVVCNFTVIWLQLSHSGYDWSKIWFWPRSLWKSGYKIRATRKCIKKRLVQFILWSTTAAKKWLCLFMTLRVLKNPEISVKENK